MNLWHLIIVAAALCRLSPATPFTFTILHTNDLHSHVEGNGPDGKLTLHPGDGIHGNYARLATLVDRIREEKKSANEPVLLVDAGDFFSGSLFDTLAPRPALPLAPELELMSLLGYDAFTLGNHEFDAGETGLHNMLEKVLPTGLLSHLITTNIFFHHPDSRLQPLFTDLPRYLVRELKQGNQTLKVGILGFLGPDAARDCAINRDAVGFKGFDDAKVGKQMPELAAEAKEMARFLREEKGVDLVIALLHGGDPEDRQLAKVKGIDIVIAGHTHKLYETPKHVRNTWVAQTGSYGRNLGVLTFSYTHGRLDLLNKGKTYIPITDSIPADSRVAAKIIQYKQAINEILTGTGYRYDSFVTTIDKDLKHGGEPINPLGRFVTSRIRNALNKRAGGKVDLYFTALSLIREDLTTDKGKAAKYQFSDIYRLLPIGFGQDFRPGSPIVTFFLSRAELKKLLEIMEIERKMTGVTTLGISDSLDFRVRPLGIPFVNRLADLKLNGKPYSQWPEFVEVGTTEYVARYLTQLPARTHGLLHLSFRNKSGEPMPSPEILDVPGEAFLFAESFRSLD